MHRREFVVSALLSKWALGASRDAGVSTTQQHPFPHGKPIVSFATSPDGRFLVTGAECAPDHADDPLEGVACWDLQTLTQIWTTKVDGGVGLADQLRGGLKFSPDGTLVGANFHTNGVAILDAATGALLRKWELSGADDAPMWCWSSDPTQPGTIVIAVEGKLLFAPLRGQERASGIPLGKPVAFDAEGVTVVRRDSISRGLQRVPLMQKSGAPVVSVAVSETNIVVATEAGELIVLDRKTFSVRHRLALSCVAVGAPVRGDAVMVRSRTPREAAVVRQGRIEPIRSPVADAEWMTFADGLPVALSPDATRAAAISPEGEVFEASLMVRRPLGMVTGAQAVTWPRADRLVVLGPRVVAVIEPRAGVRLLSRLA